MGKTFPIVRAITQKTNKIYQTMLALLKLITLKNTNVVSLSSRGMPIPCFRPSKSVAVNIEVYINEYLQPRLLPFIHKHHSDFNFQFMHDLAGAHYL
jgi:hypothetical protein